MSSTNLPDDETNAAYRRAFLRTGRSLRIASFLVTLIGGALAIVARDGVVPPWLAIAVIAAGGVLMLSASYRRARFQQKFQPESTRD